MYDKLCESDKVISKNMDLGFKIHFFFIKKGKKKNIGATGKSGA